LRNKQLDYLITFQKMSKGLNIKPGSVESVKHRCPFLLDLLEMGAIIEQKHTFVTLNNEAE